MMLPQEFPHGSNGARPNEIVEFNAIRIFATFSVIVVHIATPVANKFVLSENFNWWIGNLYESVFRSGIPLFLMLTGALLLSRAKGLKFIKKRLVRVLIPFTFWTLIYILAKNKIRYLQLEDVFNALDAANWYVYFILVVYMLLPVFKTIILQSKPSITFVFFLIIITTLTLKPISYFNPELDELFNPVIYFQYIAFGYCLVSEEKVKWLQNVKVGVILILAGIFITFAGTFFLSEAAGEQRDFFYQSSTTHVFLKAVGVWIVLKHIVSTISPAVRRLISKISMFSFGIFLIHPLVNEHILVVRLGITPLYINAAVGILLSSSLCFIISAMIIYTLSKLPFGKYTF